MKREFVGIAFRNVLLHKTRNGLTGICIALGTFSIIVGLSFTEGIIRQTIIGFTGTMIEDVMVFPKQETKDAKKTARGNRILEGYQKIQTAISQIDGIDYITKKVQFGGVIFSDRSQLSAYFIGMEPEGIRRKDNLEMLAGEYLEEGDIRLLNISQKLANRLKITVGDTVAITVNMPKGGTNAADFQVKGIFESKTGLQWVDFLVYLSLTDTQDLMGLKRDQVLSLGVYLKDVDGVDRYEKLIGDTLREKKLSGFVLSWKKVIKEVLASYKFVKYTVFAFTIILVFIVATGVVNAVFMAIGERTREIGTMLALGAKKRTIIQLFALEGIILSAVSSFIGCVTGIGFVMLVKSLKIEVASKGLILFFGGKTVTPYLENSTVVFAFLFVIAITMIGILYPAVKAAEMEPTKALGHV